MFETLRSELKVHTLYYEKASGQYLWTPDGIGCYWLTAEGACHEFGDDVTATLIEKLED